MSAQTANVSLASARRHLLAHVSAAVGRLRLQEAVRAGVASATVVLWALVALVLVERLLRLSGAGISIWMLAGALAALALPYILYRSFGGQRNLLGAAALVDDRLGLHSRLCTAVSLRPEEDSGFGEAFFEEAAGRLARVDTRSALPVRWPRSAALLPIPVLLAVGIWVFVPQKNPIPWEEYAQKRQAEEERVKAGAKLELALEDLKRETAGTEDAAAEYRAQRELLQRAQNLAKDVQEGRKSREEALIEAAKIRQDAEAGVQRALDNSLSEQLKRLNQQDFGMGPQDATRPLSEALAQGDLEKAARELRKLSRKIEQEADDGKTTPEQKAERMANLEKELEKLAGALKDSPELREQMKELAQQSEEYQKFAEEIAKQTREAGDRSAKEKLQQLEENMERLAGDLEKRSVQEKRERMRSAKQSRDLKKAMDKFMQGMDSKGEGDDNKEDLAGEEGEGDDQAYAAVEAPGGEAGEEGEEGKGAGAEVEGEGGEEGPPGDGMGSGKGVGKRPYRYSKGDFVNAKLKGKLQKGAITGLSFFRGQGAKTEAPQALVEVMGTVYRDADAALELDRIPADDRELVKNYFSRMKAEVSGKPAPAPAPKP